MNTSNTAPYEVLAASAEAWIATVGTAFPDPDEAPGGGWSKIGTAGDRNYSREGVKVIFSESVEKFRAAGSTGVVKMFSVDEDIAIELDLVDMTAEAFRHVLNYNAITTTAAAAGTPGTKEIGLSKGPNRVQRALLIRIPSPYGDGMVGQYEIPIVSPTGNAEPVHRPSQPASLKVRFEAIEDPNAASEATRYGRWNPQTGPAA